MNARHTGIIKSNEEANKLLQSMKDDGGLWINDKLLESIKLPINIDNTNKKKSELDDREKKLQYVKKY